MKRLHKILLGFVMMVTMLAGYAQARMIEASAEYSYSIFIYSGKEGHFPDGSRMKRIDGKQYGEQVTIDVRSMGIQLDEGDKYYVRGVTEAGHDNDEVGGKTYQSYTFTVTGDVSFSVAYGVAGGMVKYTVNYVDEDGESIRESEEFYGMPGDKPVVSFQYVEGYRPKVLNLAKTLNDNEASNVFTFEYIKTSGPQDSETIDEGTTYVPGNTSTGNNNTGTDDSTAPSTDEIRPENENNTTPEVNPSDNSNNNNEPQDYVDLDEEEVPLANPDNENIDNNGTPKGNFLENPVALGGTAAGIGALLGVLLFVLGKRKKDDDEEAE